MGIRDLLRNVSANVTERGWWRSRLTEHVVRPVSAARYGTDGVFVPDADWDNLIILDACRADLFEDVVDTTQFDEYRRVTSLASMTAEWSKKKLGW